MNYANSPLSTANAAGAVRCRMQVRSWFRNAAAGQPDVQRWENVGREFNIPAGGQTYFNTSANISLTFSGQAGTVIRISERKVIKIARKGLPTVAGSPQ